MDVKPNTEDNRREAGELDNELVNNEPDDTDIGTGRKVGLYGCAFLVLALAAIILIMFLTGAYVPFVGIEGVGP